MHCVPPKQWVFSDKTKSIKKHTTQKSRNRDTVPTIASASAITTTTTRQKRKCFQQSRSNRGVCQEPKLRLTGINSGARYYLLFNNHASFHTNALTLTPCSCMLMPCLVMSKQTQERTQPTTPYSVGRRNTRLVEIHDGVVVHDFKGRKGDGGQRHTNRKRTKKTENRTPKLQTVNDYLHATGGTMQTEQWRAPAKLDPLALPPTAGPLHVRKAEQKQQQDKKQRNR